MINQFNSAHHYYVLKWLSLFQETKNPIYAWRTYQNARGFGLPVPDEILEYLDEAAYDIVNIANDPPKPNIRPLAIAKALGLGKSGPGADSIFNEYKDRIHNKEIAIETYENLKQSEKEYIVFEEISQKHKISESTVRRIYKDHLEKWDEAAKQFIKDKLVTFGEDGLPQISIVGTSDDFREAAVILSLIENHMKDI